MRIGNIWVVSAGWCALVVSVAPQIGIAQLAPAGSSVGALPPDFQGRITYQGNFSGRRTEPSRTLRRGGLVGGRTREFAGPATIEVEYDGSAVRATYVANGARSSLAGTRHGTSCRVIDAHDGGIGTVRCDRNSFSGVFVSAPGAAATYRTTVETYATRVVGSGQASQPAGTQPSSDRPGDRNRRSVPESSAAAQDAQPRASAPPRPYRGSYQLPVPGISIRSDGTLSVRMDRGPDGKSRYVARSTVGTETGLCVFDSDTSSSSLELADDLATIAFRLSGFPAPRLIESSGRHRMYQAVRGNALMRSGYFRRQDGLLAIVAACDETGSRHIWLHSVEP
ncbi:MAG TPA: hypothetical protein VF603_04640 [Allosphingosinicella sp.]|jgi:hypothetical protein